MTVRSCAITSTRSGWPDVATLCRVRTATLRGVAAVPVDVEVCVSNGMPGFSVVGMADAAVQESRERVRAAIRACGFTMPTQKVVVNLAPGSLRKTGSGFDLPIAVGLLCATGQVDRRAFENLLVVGELSLEGAVRPVAGMLAFALCAKQMGLTLLGGVEPGAHRIEGLERKVISTLGELHGERPSFSDLSAAAAAAQPQPLDFRDIAGHDMAKRALQIAAAGSHGVLMMGPPGSGKTMLASRIPSILPPLSRAEALETAVIYSVTGGDMTSALMGIRPFCAPHHSASLAGLVGGGSPPRPGSISLAHNGVLFLDELPEFAPSVLQGIRQPMESGEMVITRADGNVVFPARFILVAAANPCPCGYFGDREHACTCSQHRIAQYQGRIGGPVLDRIDVHIDVARIPAKEVLSTGSGTSSEKLREGVLAAREYASWRRAHTDLDERGARSEALVRSCDMSESDAAFFEEIACARKMSGRAIMRTLSLARTIADMECAARVGRDHLCEAVSFRLRDGVGQ